jgi:hypothetical protein
VSFSPRCAEKPRCQRRRVPLEELRAYWGGPADGRKAVSQPATKSIWRDKATWARIRTTQGRLALFCHEWAHVEGAKCETCADFGAGVLMRELGEPVVRDAARDFYALLENRDGAVAVRDISEGFERGQVRQADADVLEDKPRKVVTGFLKGQHFQLRVVEVESGRWLAEAAGRAYLRGKAKAKAAGVSGSLASAFRTEAEQRAQLTERAEYAAKLGWSPHQRGEGIDVQSSTTEMRSRFKAHLVAEGFKLNASEDWHLDYWGAGAITPDGPPPSLASGRALAGAGGLLLLAMAALAALS